MNVILHSDDLGLTRELTRGILDALDAGLLDGVSVLANGPALDVVEARLPTLTGRSLRAAVHLNLSEGRPVAPVEEIPWLVDTAGHLRLSFGRCLAGLLLCTPRVRRARCAQIEAEWRAQIHKVKCLLAPLPVDALDGHTHIHMLPFVFPVVVRLARQEGVRAIRVSREVLGRPISARDWWRPDIWRNQLKRVVLGALALPRPRQVAAAGLSAPAAITGVLYTGDMSRRAVLAAIWAARRRGLPSLEVVLHVGPARAAVDAIDAPSTVRQLRALERCCALQRRGEY